MQGCKSKNFKPVSTPTNRLTTQLVHQFMKETNTDININHNHDSHSKQKYPRIKYITNVNKSFRSTEAFDFRSKIHQLIRQQQTNRIKQYAKYGKNGKFKSKKKCVTQLKIFTQSSQISPENISSQKRSPIKFKGKHLDKQIQRANGDFDDNQQKISRENRLASLVKQYKTSSHNSFQNLSSKYLSKISKIKKHKLKKYNKNKFAIESKPINTSRNKAHMMNFQKTGNLRQQISMLMQSTKQSSKQNKQSKAQINRGKKPIHSQKQIKHERQTFVLPIFNNNKSESKIKIQKDIILTDAEEHPAETRFKKMCIEFNRVLNSFGVEFQRANSQIIMNYSRHAPKLKFYVGIGNNKNLIISIMKKRWWWSETKNITQANFMWTQLKNKQIIQKSEKQYRVLQNKLGKQHFFQLEQQSSKAQRQIQLLNKKKKRDQQKKPYNYEINKNNIKIIVPPTIVHNHYNGNGFIGNKKSLFYCLTAYSKFADIDITTFLPSTFHLLKNQKQSFLKFQQTYKKQPKTLWIVKPGQNSNRGKDIFMTKSIRQIQERLKKINNKSSLIVQKYIKDLYLYDRRKFDIRCFLAAITIGGVTKYFWYNQGYIRTSSYAFDMQNYKDVYIHLTNDAVQNQSKNYSKFQQGNKLSYKQFQRYLNNKTVGFQKQNMHSVKKLHEQMKKITKIAIKSTHPLVKPGQDKTPFAFQLFGLDFIIDSNFKPWLIQINTNPCLELSSKCLHRLIPQMLQNCFKIALDPIFQPMFLFPRSIGNTISDDIFKFNRFQVIYDEMVDKDLQWQMNIKEHISKLYKPKSNSLALQEFKDGEQQEYDSNGCQIDIQY